MPPTLTSLAGAGRRSVGVRQRCRAALRSTLLALAGWAAVSVSSYSKAEELDERVGLAGGEQPVAEEATPSPKPAEARRLEVTGFVDLYYSYNFNRPADHANFFPGAGTTAKRDDEFAINLAQVDFIVAPKPVGVHIAAGYGNSMEVVHAAEVDGVATSPGIWQNIVQASLEYQANVGRGLLLEAGLYPSHIGFETLQSKDDWNYTRSWEAEFSPYYQMGVKLAYPLGERWSAQLHFLNGWQVIADNNRGKTLGWQFAYAGDKVSVTLNGIAGPELPEDDHDLRALSDTVAVWKATPSWSLALCLDLGGQEQPAGGNATWEGVALYARFAPPDGQTAVALRAEYFDDEQGAISGTAQILKEVTATLEIRPAKQLSLKVEGRYDRSTALVFAGDTLDPLGDVRRDQRDEALLVIGAVATF
jgi:putative OmpL-like beta-barrel porin-2